MADVNRSLATLRRQEVGVGEDGPPADKLQLPAMLEFLFDPSRYKVLRGGRGGAKSWGVARALLILGGMMPLRILCARELQVSIAESVHKLLSDQIAASPALSSIYEVQKKTITNTLGTEFLFEGIRNNVTKIKSMEGIDIAWVEEAEKVSHSSWQVLIPTIRKAGSQIWVTFNPDLETDPTYKRFVLNPPPGTLGVEINWQDNPWFPAELRAEMEYLYRVDPEAAEHVWGGKCRTNSEAAILRGKWVVEHFTPEPGWDGPYYGADWGFSTDPSTCVKVWIHANKLYIEYEAYAVGVEIDATPELFDTVPGARKGSVRADSARPETISYMQRHGYGGIVAAIKWPGSVEDGIAFLRSFEQIVIHPRCTYAKQEAMLYCYKVDRLTSEVTTDIVDKHNHIWDAVRYALELILRQSNMGMLNYLKDLSEDQKRERAEAEALLAPPAPVSRPAPGGGVFR